LDVLHRMGDLMVRRTGTTCSINCQRLANPCRVVDPQILQTL
jgi:hypothetical protein